MSGRLKSEQGLTIVEVLVAALIASIMGIAVMGLVSAATRGDFRAQQSQVINDRLQAEMEKIKGLPYGQVALTSQPQHSANQADPNWRVSGASFALNRDGTGLEPLAYNGGTSYDQNSDTVSGGTVDPGPTPFSVGGVSGKIYRYVTWHRDSGCGNCQAQYLKRVTVIALLDTTASGGARAYGELQSDIANPNADAPSGPCSNCSPSNPPWTFWLTDTPCNQTSRQPITADNLTHDTLGVCSAGIKTGPPGLLGANAGAPDLMFTQAPPCVANDCTQPQPTYDYSTDVEAGCGQVNCDPTDIGLQELRPTNILNGGACLTDLSGINSLLSLGSDPEWYIHKWLSNPIPNGQATITLSGTGALDLWTQSVAGASYSGRICVWLFTRYLNGLGIPVDTFAVNTSLKDACDSTRTISVNLTYFPCSFSVWPHGGWTEIHIPLRFAQITLPVGYRLGVAIGVEGQGTSGSGLQFMYDAPTFDSRLQVWVNPGVTLPF